MKSMKDALQGLTIKNTTLDFSQEVLSEFVCEGCREKVQRIKMMGFNGKYFEANKGCRCEEIELVKECIRNRDRAKKRRVLEFFDSHSLIPKKLRDCSFENFIPEHETQFKAFKLAKDFVTDFDLEEGENLLFSGSYGVGKSHLSVAITQEIMNKGFTAIFISVPKLLTKIRATYKQKDVSEADVIKALEEVDLLVFDDLGAERSTDWATEMLFQIIDDRQGKHTVFTTNLNSQELKERIGDRNFSRLMADTQTQLVTGEDHRLKGLTV